MSRDDPTIERVRAARRKIFEECGCDLHALYEWAKKLEAEFPERLASYNREGGRRFR